MSEQTEQTGAFVPPTYLGDMRVYDLGATTLADCYKQGMFKKQPSAKYKNKKPDLLIVSNDGEIVLFMESKTNDNLSSAADISKAYKQEFAAAKNVGSRIFALRDANKTYWYNPMTGNMVLDETGQPLNFHLTPVDKPLESERMIRRIMVSIDAKNDRLWTSAQQNPTDLARKVHQRLFTWKSVSPATALYTFVEIFLFKYLSDLGILKGMDSFEHLMSLYEENSNLKVLQQYMKGPRTTIEDLFPANMETPSVKPTTVINGTVFHEDVGDAETFRDLLELFQDYEKDNGKFIDISPDFKSQLFETFLKQEDDKKRLGQFFTPLKIVKNMVRTIDLHDGMSICDPACGVGKFLLEAVGGHIEQFYKYNRDAGGVQSKISITGFDRETEDNHDLTIILAKANTLIYFSKFLLDHPSAECAKSLTKQVLNKSFMLKTDSLGTLETLEEDKYDVILANPPYLVNGSKDTRDKANRNAIVLERHGNTWRKSEKKNSKKYAWGGVGLESLFLEWIVRSLKPGGHASVVIPDGILRNANNASLRENIASQCIIESVISLPVNAFFSTAKKTYVLNLCRKTPNENGILPSQQTKVFTYICSSIGETLDIYRFDDPENDDLKDAVDTYNVYRSMRDANSIDASAIDTYMGQLPNHIKARYRLLEANKFINGSWVVEDYWSEDEKIALGLRNDKENLTPARFVELLRDTISVMDDYAKELSCME